MLTDHGRGLFRQALVDFRLNPETHQQDAWICGTRCCLAGSIVQLAGWKPHYGDTPGWPANETNDIIGVDGEHGVVSVEAREILGIDQVDVKILFNASNTIDDLEGMYRVLDSGEPLTERCQDGCSGRHASAALQAELPDVYDIYHSMS